MVNRLQAAWRFGYADALLGDPAKVCYECDVERDYVDYYMNGRRTAMRLGLFGLVPAHRPGIALRLAVDAV